MFAVEGARLKAFTCPISLRLIDATVLSKLDYGPKHNEGAAASGRRRSG